LIWRFFLFLQGVLKVYYVTKKGYYELVFCKQLLSLHHKRLTDDFNYSNMPISKEDGKPCAICGNELKQRDFNTFIEISLL
jgi:hypothetical protein